MLSLFKDELSLGIDFGSDSLKIVELIEGEKVATLKKYAIEKLPQGLIEEGIIKDSAALSEELKIILKNYKFKSKEAIIAINPAEITVKCLNLPQVNGAELEETIYWEVSNYISFPVEEAIIDYQVVEEGSDFLKLVLVAIKKKIVNDYFNLLKRSSLEVKAIEIEALSLNRILNFNQDFNNQNLLIIDLGAELTKFILFKEGKLNLREAFNFGTKTLKLQLKEGSSDMKYFFNKVLARIKRFLYYQLEHDQKLDRILLIGGGSKLEGLSSFLNEELELEVDIFDSLLGFDFDLDKFNSHQLREDFPMMATAVGLSLWGDKND